MIVTDDVVRGAGAAIIVRVAGNRVSASAFGGIPAYESRRVVIADNGVGTHDIRVVENMIEDSAFEGIAVVGSDGNLIARNRAARNGGGDAAGGIEPPDSIRSAVLNRFIDAKKAEDQRPTGRPAARHQRELQPTSRG